MRKTRIWFVSLWCGTLYVGETMDLPGACAWWKVRAITARAAARKLLRGGTIAEAIAKQEFEWDNPGQPQRHDSPTRDRARPRVKEMVRAIKIVRVRKGGLA